MKRVFAIAAVLLLATGAGVIAARLSSTSARIPNVESVSLFPGFYGLKLDGADVAVTGGVNGNGCGAQLYDATSLRLIRTVASCVGDDASSSGPLAMTGPAHDELHVAVANPSTHRTTLGPLLMTIQNWPWAHSGVTTGDGSIWIAGFGTDSLLQVSLKTGRIEHRWKVNPGGNPWMAVDDDGFWMTSSVWGGGPFSTPSALWHVAPGSGKLVARTIGDGTQWFVASGHSIYLDELTKTEGGYDQSVWRVDGPQERIAFTTSASILPAPNFAGMGYVVEGNPKLGLFTLSQIGAGHTPVGIGDCDASALLRIVRIDPATGKQSYVATLAAKDAGTVAECALADNGQVIFSPVFGNDALYLLADVQPPGNRFGSLLRVSV